MPYSSVNKAEPTYTTPTLTRASKSTAGEVAIGAHRTTGSTSVRTSIFLTEEVVAVTGFRKGSRVTLLRGTGKDEGKVRIVANRKGKLKIGGTIETSPYSICIRSSRLLERTRKTKPVQITSYARGALTVSL